MHVVTYMYMSHEHAHCLTVLGAHKYFRRNVIGRATERVCHFTSLQALLWIIKWRHCYDVIASKMRSSHFVKKNDKPGCNCAQKKKRSQHPSKDNNNSSNQTTVSGNLLLTSIANYLHVASSRGYPGSSRPRSDVRSSRPDSDRRMMVQCQGPQGASGKIVSEPNPHRQCKSSNNVQSQQNREILQRKLSTTQQRFDTPTERCHAAANSWLVAWCPYMQTVY